MKDGRGFWVGDYWGVISIGANQNIVKNVPKTFADLLKPDYKDQVALNGSPLTSGSALAGVFAAALANGGSLSNVGPGIDWFAKLKSVGNWVPVPATPQTVASGQTPISIDWDYNNLAYVKEFPAAKWKVTNIPADGVYGGYYCQAINATAPHPWAARLWQEFIYSDQGQLLYLKGYVHPARFTDMVARKVIPKALTSTLPAGWLYSEGEVRERQAGPRRADRDQGAVAREGRGLGSEYQRRRIRRAPAGPRARPAPAGLACLARRRPVLRLRRALPHPPVPPGDDRRLQG